MRYTQKQLTKSIWVLIGSLLWVPLTIIGFMIARWNFERYENKMFTAFQRLAARHADITQVKSYALASSNASFFPDNGPGEAMVEIEVPWYIYGSSFSRELFIFKVRGTRIESVERVVHTGAL